MAASENLGSPCASIAFCRASTMEELRVVSIKTPPCAEPTMLPNDAPHLIETLLRLPLLEAAQLRELIQHLPDPQAAAEEMVRRGWITHNQFWSLFPDPQQRPTPRETMLVGFGHD